MGAPRARSSRARRLGPAPGRTRSRPATRPGVCTSPCPGVRAAAAKPTLEKVFFLETWAWRSPAQCFLIWGAFPENVAKKLSQRAEEHAFSGRVKTNHRLPCSFSSLRLESPARPHTARRLGWFATQPPDRGCSRGLGIRPGSGFGPRSLVQVLPNPPATEPGPGAAAPGGHAGEPRRRLQRPELLIAADPSGAHPPPQPPHPGRGGGALRLRVRGPVGPGPESA